MNTSYWQRALAQRLTRRRALVSSGGVAAGAALLAACGGSSSSGGDKSSLLVKPVDTTKQAKRGGILKHSVGSDPVNVDPHGGGGAGVPVFYEIMYSRLFTYKPGLLQPAQDEIEGQIAQSWEWTPDRLQVTAKIRPGVKFHNIAPVNGRAMDADDILYSWKRFSTQGSNRTVVANSANPDAPVVSVTSPDPTTIVIKFKEPLVYAQAYLAQRGYLSIVPKEAENTSVLDLRTKALGTGPFMLADYQPSAGLTFKRHADYWDKERPYVDQVNFPIVTEYAAALSQFRGGNIHAYIVNQDDILQTKQAVPQLNMYEGNILIDTRRTIFGWEQASVRDKRVRQALSMSIDRDTWIDAQYNTQSFESQGLPVSRRWNTTLEATEDVLGWWLDPKGKDFGPNAKYYEHNIAEAKKLLAAAGYTGEGPEIQSNHLTTSENGTDYVKLIEVWEGMAAEAGFRYKKNIITYSDFLRNYRDTNGRWFGVTYKRGPPAPSSDATAKLTYEFSVKGGVGFQGFDVAGKGDGSGDPYIETALSKARGDFDTEARRKVVQDLQRYLAEQQYTIRWPGGATAFELAWPALKNYRVYRPGSQQENMVATTTWWLDETQPPLNKA